MDPLGSSECSSGCESGWTLYLDHSVSSPNPSNYREIHGFNEKTFKEKWVDEEDDEEEEEDLSMVSDASSGPPHFNEDEAYDYAHNKHYSVSSSSRETTFNSLSGKKQRKRENRRRRDDRKTTSSFVDDTASSSSFNSNFSVNNINQGNALDYSQGFSATHFQEGRPAFQEDFGLFQSGNPMQNNQWF